jgi:ketosteroid isomerase-like protein
MPSTRRNDFLALALLAVLAGPASLAAQATDHLASLAAADRQGSEASGRSGFAAALLGALADDGAVLWPRAPVAAGRDRIRRLLRDQKILDSARVSWQPLGLEVSSDGSFGVSWGVMAAGRDAAPPRLGRYIAAWRRAGGDWKLAALVTLGVFPAATGYPGDFPRTLPPSAPRGPAGHFVAADLGFARMAGDSGAPIAFERFADPEAVTFAGGVLHRGPASIRRALELGGPADWAWHPVLSGGSASGDLGFTVGESEIRPRQGPATYGKYLTIWRRDPNGRVGYLTDGGNARPGPP